MEKKAVVSLSLFLTPSFCWKSIYEVVEIMRWNGWVVVHPLWLKRHIICVVVVCAWYAYRTCWLFVVLMSEYQNFNISIVIKMRFRNESVGCRWWRRRRKKHRHWFCVFFVVEEQQPHAVQWWLDFNFVLCVSLSY